MRKELLNQLGANPVKVVMLITTILILLVVVSAASSKALRTKRDHQRASDVAQLQKALKFYFDQYGIYPRASENMAVGENNSFSKFVATWPTSPKGGQCVGQYAAYKYEQQNDGERYQITFCLEKGYANLGPGIRIATPEEVR